MSQHPSDSAAGKSNTSGEAPANADWLRIVQQKVESLRYGVVQLVVHDGQVTQIERTEKTRLSASHAHHRDRTAP